MFEAKTSLADLIKFSSHSMNFSLPFIEVATLQFKTVCLWHRFDNLILLFDESVLHSKEYSDRYQIIMWARSSIAFSESKFIS